MINQNIDIIDSTINTQEVTEVIDIKIKIRV